MNGSSDFKVALRIRKKRFRRGLIESKSNKKSQKQLLMKTEIKEKLGQGLIFRFKSSGVSS
jgi:hypothetical protein